MESKSIKFYIYCTLAFIYFIPIELIFGVWNSAPYHLYTCLMGMVYFVNMIRKGKIKKTTLALWMGIILICFYTKKFGFLDLLLIPIVDDLINNKNRVNAILKKNKLVYLALFFSFIYTIIYNKVGFNGRGADAGSGFMTCTALGEVNLAGLSIFLLYGLAKNKYKYLSKIILIFGIFTFSRSYFLAIICIILCSTRLVNKLIEKLIRKLSYINLTLISSVFTFGLAILQISVFLNNRIVAMQLNSGFARMFQLNDYSNFYRMLAIFIVVAIYVYYPKFLLVGITDDEYLLYGREIANNLNVPFIGIGPHNLFFSHLKIYGIGVVFEVFFISKYLKKIVNKNNFGFFIAVLLYAIVMGSGFNNWWLFLITIVLIVNEK